MATDTYFVDTGKTEKNTILKDPQAVLDYSFDWTAWLTPLTDTILTASFIVDPSLSVVTQFKSTMIATVFISGGALNRRVPVTCRIVTAGGRTDERTIYLKILNR